MSAPQTAADLYARAALVRAIYAARLRSAESYAQAFTTDLDAATTEAELQRHAAALGAAQAWCDRLAARVYLATRWRDAIGEALASGRRLPPAARAWLDARH